MRGFVANTDYDELSFLRSIVPAVDEINFWKAGTDATFKALAPGEPLFFRLKAPHNAIGGFGYFAHFSILPLSIAWQVYGIANGCGSYAALRHRLESIRTRFNMKIDSRSDYRVGCILVNGPVFFNDGDEVRTPADWSDRIVQGKSYDLTTGEGARIWNECLARTPKRHDYLADGLDLYSAGPLFRARLGPRSFRIAVLDAYGRQCSITGERALPALDAAHVRPFEEQEHSVNNGILFRADIQKLFESGYVTIDRDLRFRVSRHVKEAFDDGRAYYALEGTPMRFPVAPEHHPLPEALWWHNEERYLG